ncbi:MAG TPA: MFS transporter [Candidatus Baltobacteraceae bacterium]|nr:MFS transporter [Candidatus Baltobacteraceae bacterium]
MGRSAGVVLALYLVTVAVFADMYITQPLLPQLARDFGVDAATAGLTLSAVVLTTALASSAYGPLSDVLGRRPIMVGGAFALALATLACGFAPSLGALVGLRAAQGVLVPAVSALAVAYIADELSGDAGLVIGGYMASSIVGGLVGRIGSGVLAGAYDWRAPFVALAAFTALGAAVLAAALPRATRARRPPHARFLPDLALSYAAMLRHVRDVRLAGAFAIGAALFFGFIGIFTYLPFALTGPPFGLSTAAVAWIYLAYLAGVVVSPIAGRLTGFVPRRLLIALGIVVAIAGMLMTLSAQLWVVVAGAVVMCAGMFVAQPVVPTFVAVNAGDAKGSAVALYQSFYYLGAMFGSAVPGLALERGGWNGVVAACASALVLALLADWLLCGGTSGSARNRGLPRSAT